MLKHARGSDLGGRGMPAGAEETIAEAGEQRTLERILSILPAAQAPVGPGDDAAVLAAPDGRVVITNDTLIEGPDFRSAWSDARSLGRKAVATNLSDVAAMGAAPTGLVIALALPGSTPLSWVREFATGVAERAGALVVGGDLATAPVRVISVTAFGDLAGRRPVLRSGARAGDQLALAGTAGLAAAGLHLLFASDPGGADDQAVANLRACGEATARLINTQLAPLPPLGAGIAAADAGATAMMDVSDGLALDSSRIARASGVGIELELDALTEWIDAVREGLTPVLGAVDARRLAPELVVRGGEDHALLATFPGDAELPHPFRRIGTVTDHRGDVRVDGHPIEPRGWDPFATASGAS